MAVAFNEITTATSYRSVLAKKVWDKVVHEEAIAQSYFRKAGLLGPDRGREASFDEPNPGVVIGLKSDQFQRNKGDRIVIAQHRALTGSGVAGTTALYGSEESMAFYDMILLIDHQRHATGWVGPMAQQRTDIDLAMRAKASLTNWMAKTIDDAIFDALYSRYAAWLATDLSQSQVTHPNVIYGGGAASYAGVGNTDVMNTEVLERVAEWVDENYIPPVETDFGPRHILVIHPRQAFNLRRDEVWRDAQKDAGVQGRQNPIFTKAEGEWAGIVVHTSTKVASPTTTEDTGGFHASKRKALLLGAYAGFLGFGSADGFAPGTETGTYTAGLAENDYGLNHGFAIGALYGVQRADWISEVDGSTAVNQSSAVVCTFAQSHTS